jgi:poly(A) RNA polymerase
MINKRKSEAQKSLLVQVNSEKSYQELFNYCSQFGDIKSAFHYNTSHENFHFILLEYEKVSGCEEALKNCDHNYDKPGVPVSSPFLWFKALKNKPKLTSLKDPVKLQNDEIKIIEDEHLFEVMSSAESLDDQIIILYRMTKLNDLGLRLRYLAGRQLEMSLKGMFPSVEACLFGSSINGFGKMGCDVDLILRLNEKHGVTNEGRLIFHSKHKLSNERTNIQRQMEVIGDIMHNFLPAINNVRKILNARVPIIKYNHECLDLDIDFSMNNLSGLYMSELLYLYGELDKRVRPLVFCIRKWANAVGLTNPASPGRWITNFPLTVLILFFLQNLRKPILPPFNLLVKSASPPDIRITEDDINCTFMRDLNKLQFEKKNDDPLHVLLFQFFEFYSKFDFKDQGVSMIEGKAITKPDHSAMWITNPLEPLLNVSKNLSHEELEKLKSEAKNAAWILETSDKKKQQDDWGLLSLFRVGKKKFEPEMFFKPRLLHVTDLFSEEENPQQIQYKNPQIKSAVKQIQKVTKQEISNLRKRS